MSSSCATARSGIRRQRRCGRRGPGLADAEILGDFLAEFYGTASGRRACSSPFAAGAGDRRLCGRVRRPGGGRSGSSSPAAARTASSSTSPTGTPRPSCGRQARDAGPSMSSRTRPRPAAPPRDDRGLRHLQHGRRGIGRLHGRLPDGRPDKDGYRKFIIRTVEGSERRRQPGGGHRPEIPEGPRGRRAPPRPDHGRRRKAPARGGGKGPGRLGASATLPLVSIAKREEILFTPAPRKASGSSGPPRP